MQFLEKQCMCHSVECVFLCVFQTPLHCAAASTHGAVCLEILVNEHADVNAKVAAVFALF